MYISVLSISLLGCGTSLERRGFSRLLSLDQISQNLANGVEGYYNKGNYSTTDSPYEEIRKDLLKVRNNPKFSSSTD